MKCVIRPVSRQARCPKCHQKFKHFEKIGFICPDCKTTPNRFYIDIHWNSQRPQICSDSQGQALDTYQRALNLSSHIQYEIDNFVFDPSKYVASDIKRFWVITLLDRFLNAKINNIAPSYQKDYKRMVNMAKDYFNTKDVRDLRKLDVINYKDHLSNNFTLSSKTIKNILDLLKTFLNWCRSDIEVISIVPPFPEIEIQEYNFKWLSQNDQIQAFECIDEHDKPIIASLILHGYRPSEARALKCKDVDLRNQTITITSTFSGRVYREKRKGKKSRAVTIPIHTELLDYLTERVKNNLPESWLFVNRQGRYYSENALRRIWDKVRTKLGIDKGLRLYDATRHSFASNLVNSGTSIFKVSKLLGHSSVKMTEKYAHKNIESLRADINKISLHREQTVNSKIVPLKSGSNNS